jgi:hypothetical protein
MPNASVCQICGGAIPDAKRRETHTALCAGVVNEELNEALSDVARLRAKVKLASVLLREVLSGADILTNKKWMRMARNNLCD